MNPTSVSDAHAAVRPSTETHPSGVLQDQLGLTVLHKPDDAPSIDIVFVHGLGGKSQKTWTKDKKPQLFWPKEWLPKEEGMKNARILTFGYDANFLDRGPNRTWRISDFAEDLVYQLDIAAGEANFQIGKVSRLSHFQASFLAGYEVVDGLDRYR